MIPPKRKRREEISQLWACRVERWDEIAEANRSRNRQRDGQLEIYFGLTAWAVRRYFHMWNGRMEICPSAINGGLLCQPDFGCPCEFWSGLVAVRRRVSSPFGRESPTNQCRRCFDDDQAFISVARHIIYRNPKTYLDGSFINYHYIVPAER
jgi:hypothetical protein